MPLRHPSEAGGIPRPEDPAVKSWAAPSNLILNPVDGEKFISAAKLYRRFVFTHQTPIRGNSDLTTNLDHESLIFKEGKGGQKGPMEVRRQIGV
jgi:hypothetical protein